MFGFTAIISLSFLLASQSAVAGSAPHNPRSLGLAIRAASDPTITPACTTACRQWNKTIDNIFSSNDSLAMCTNVVMSQFESCWDCEAYTGAASVNSLQDSINCKTHRVAPRHGLYLIPMKHWW
ncbi:hypothetical protein B0H15DRAFT_300218 [Mycena belliarum]|uniref:Uncharacterized protein n=1 Tax=Mycena belliarum TaxID=1033014 RepID=A0AAD6XRL9_9AGAR|nr:hypothetical protein B0H15DRAFT_300218 [Mycena belliae]